MTVSAEVFTLLTPYEFSPTVLLACTLTALLYWRGQRRMTPTSGRALAFWIGLILIYAVLQTHYDYYAQHMFFLHRLQHLVLHHLGPFLIAWTAPGAVLAAGLPNTAERWVVAPLRRNRALNVVYRWLQQPLISTLLFVGLIYLWLIPSLHFIAMLNVPLYNAMNWGMALDGLLFWWMVFNLRAPGSSHGRHYGGRILLLFLAMLPQIVLGAYIALSGRDLYDVYAVCGRAWPLTAQVDQQIGGLITWIPSAMMSLAGMLILLRRWLARHENNEPLITEAQCRHA
jgi:putative membrane protein